MGGDRGPKVILEGTIQAVKEFGVEVFLVGDQEILKAELAHHNIQGLKIYIKHAPEVVEMDEPAAAAIRKKKKSSIRVRVEHVFGSIANEQNGGFIRVIGKARAATKIGLTNLVYNMRRMVTLSRQSAPA